MIQHSAPYTIAKNALNRAQAAVDDIVDQRKAAKGSPTAPSLARLGMAEARLRDAQEQFRQAERDEPARQARVAEAEKTAAAREAEADRAAMVRWVSETGGAVADWPTVKDAVRSAQAATDRDRHIRHAKRTGVRVI